MKQWIETLQEKMSELELIASWASQVNLGRVRDFCRNAKYELAQEIERREHSSKPSLSCDYDHGYADGGGD